MSLEISKSLDGDSGAPEEANKVFEEEFSLPLLVRFRLLEADKKTRTRGRINLA